MRIMCIQGSPRKNGNTAKVLSWVEDELRKSGRTVEHVDVGDGRIRPCQACYGCKKNDREPACVIDDGANDIFAEMLLCDVVLFASPLFCWGLSAQLKALIDRTFCLIKNEERQLLAGQHLALLMTAASGVESNLELAVPPFKSYVKFFKCKEAGVLLVPNCTEPDALSAEVARQAREFAHKLTASVNA